MTFMFTENSAPKRVTILPGNERFDRLYADVWPVLKEHIETEGGSVNGLSITHFQALESCCQTSDGCIVYIKFQRRNNNAVSGGMYYHQHGHVRGFNFSPLGSIYTLIDNIIGKPGHCFKKYTETELTREPLNMNNIRQQMAAAKADAKQRTHMVTRRRVEYYEEEVNLLQYLRDNVAEVYLSNENQCVEIRFPTRTEHYTHYVGHIPFSCIGDLSAVRDDIKNERHMDVLEALIDSIVMAPGFTDTVTQ